MIDSVTRLTAGLLILFSISCYAGSGADTKINRNWYVSWGYNSELWLPSNILVSQNGLGNNFVLSNVAGHDEPGWTTGIFNKDLTVPQFNVRIGCFYNESHTRGLELNFDHTKYSTTENQVAHIKGTVNHQPVDEDVVLTKDYFTYYLHNGANHLMVNYVQRIPFRGKIGRPFSLEGVMKTGAGVMVPHASNRIMGNNNDVGPKEPGNWIGIKRAWWSYGGYTLGMEYGIRFAPCKNVFLELTDKIAFSHLSDIPVYQGFAHQDLVMMEGILSLGVAW
jgi:hypothetical protein